jgi:hypothetical protein
MDFKTFAQSTINLVKERLDKTSEIDNKNIDVVSAKFCIEDAEVLMRYGNGRYASYRALKALHYIDPFPQHEYQKAQKQFQDLS